LLVDAAASGSGHKRTLIPEDEARFSYQQVGTPEKGWYVTGECQIDLQELCADLTLSLHRLAFQPYYDEILAKSGGSFLK
jgi:hypothetical protein